MNRFQSHLDSLEQPLHESLLSGLGAQARSELGHILCDGWGETSEITIQPFVFGVPRQVNVSSDFHFY